MQDNRQIAKIKVNVKQAAIIHRKMFERKIVKNKYTFANEIIYFKLN